MRKFLPYQQYDVQAIEQWLNKQSMAGYRLVKMDGFFPTFKKYYDHLYSYRVCFRPDAKPKGYTHFWGDLYIFESQDRSQLPQPSYVKDSIEAARHQKKPFFALALMVALFAIVEAMVTGFASLSPAFLFCGSVAAIAEVVWLVTIFQSWHRGRQIAKEVINISEQLPNPKTKLIMSISCFVSISAMAAVVLL
ncbi:MAG: DUF2812 domain-containing protein [Oscillospiraceae bacterium]|nr:DUF2812 domain-containing protein [Oscillospiraceae bacterium]